MNLCYNYLFLCKESFDLHRVSEWPSDALGRRLTVPVASPARDIAVASQRERVIATRRDRDEVPLNAIGRRLAANVVAPARDSPVASHHRGVTGSYAEPRTSSRRLYSFLFSPKSSFTLPRHPHGAHHLVRERLFCGRAILRAPLKGRAFHDEDRRGGK